MFYELREYRIRKGKGDAWARLMDEIIIPFQREMGMTVVGSFVAADDPDLYIWMRRFESEADRKRLYDAVYGSLRWREEIRPAMGDMLIREKKREVIMTPTAASALR